MDDIRSCLIAMVVNVVSISLGNSSMNAADTKKALQETVLKKTLEIYAESDSLKAIAYLETQGTPIEVAENYSQLVKEFYFKKKDLAGMILFARAGIKYSLAEARRIERDDKKTALELKGITKTISYNLGSNTWPGWNDSGITITKTDLAVGLDAARINLRMAGELKRDKKVIGNAYWLIGAHYLATGKQKDAIQAFQRSADKFRDVKLKDFELMARGYLSLSQMANESTRAEGRKRYDQTISALKKLGSEDAKFFAEQLDTARLIFVK